MSSVARSQQHDEEKQLSRRPVSPDQPQHADPRADVLALQQAAGNQAVNQLLDTPNLSDPAAVRDRLGEGTSLQSSVRSRMEQAFGTSFGHVRVHTDAQSSQLVRHYSAEALTVGEHIAFKQGNYRPGTLLGDALLAHELAHTLQQQDSSTAQTHSSARLEQNANAQVVEALAPAQQRKSLRSLVGETGGRMRTGLQVQFFMCRGERAKTEEEKYQELKETLSDTESAVRAAQRLYEIQGNADAATKAGQIADTFGNVNNSIERVEQAVQLYEAVGDLRAFANADPESDPEGFARSAGRAFVRFGEALELAPPPLDSYGTFLKGMDDFFVNMARKLRPDLRYRGTEYEQYMR